MVVVAAASVVGVLILGALAPEAAIDSANLFMLVTALALTGVMCVWQSRLHQRRSRELAHLSRSDPLTECLNRRGFEARLQDELGRCRDAGLPIALIQLDLNDFKSVNDRHGHAAGDALLRWTVDVIAGRRAPRRRRRASRRRRVRRRARRASGRRKVTRWRAASPPRWPSASARPTASPRSPRTAATARRCTAAPTSASTSPSRSPARPTFSPSP